MYQSKVHFANQGDQFEIERGGTLVIGEGATVEGLPMAEHQADSTATTIAALKDDVNALLAKLIAAGLMAAAEPTE